MGMQSAGVRELGISGVTTTYVTGTWSSFIMGIMTLQRSNPSERIIKKKQDTIVQASCHLACVRYRSRYGRSGWKSILAQGRNYSSQCRRFCTYRCMDQISLDSF